MKHMLAIRVVTKTNNLFFIKLVIAQRTKNCFRANITRSFNVSSTCLTIILIGMYGFHHLLISVFGRGWRVADIPEVEEDIVESQSVRDSLSLSKEDNDLFSDGKGFRFAFSFCREKDVIFKG